MSERLAAAPRHARVRRVCGLLWTVLLVVTGCTGARTVPSPSLGQVKDPQGHPIRGARVRCERLLPPAPPEACGEAVTDGEGRYRLAALKNPPAGTTLFVEAEGYAPRSRWLPCEPGARSSAMSWELMEKMAPAVVHRSLGDFTLQRAAPLTGEVVDEQGRPVVGAVLRVSSLQRPGEWAVCEQQAPVELRTGVEGRFRFEALAVGARSLTVLGQGWHLEFARIEVREGHAELEPIVFVGRPWLAGQVVDGAGRAVVGAAVHVRFTGDGQEQSLVLHSGANGRFRLRVTGPGLYTLQAVDERSVPPRRSSEVLAEPDDVGLSLVVLPPG